MALKKMLDLMRSYGGCEAPFCAENVADLIEALLEPEKQPESDPQFDVGDFVRWRGHEDLGLLTIIQPGSDESITCVTLASGGSAWWCETAASTPRDSLLFKTALIAARELILVARRLSPGNMVSIAGLHPGERDLELTWVGSKMSDPNRLLIRLHHRGFPESEYVTLWVDRNLVRPKRAGV